MLFSDLMLLIIHCACLYVTHHQLNQPKHQQQALSASLENSGCFMLIHLQSFQFTFPSRLLYKLTTKLLLLYTMARHTAFDANAKRSTVQAVKDELILIHS